MAPRSLQLYNAATFSSSLTQIDRLVHALECIKNFAKPCEPCMIHLLHEIASHLNSLLAIAPSTNIAEELVDMNRLTKLSQQLLKLDWLGVTSTVWTLVDWKMSSLYDTRLAVPMRISWNGSRNGDGSQESPAGQTIQRRRRPRRTDFNVGERAKDELVVQSSTPRASTSDFNVVERVIDEQAQEPKPPRSNNSSFEVIRRDIHRQVEEPRAQSPDFNVVERTAPAQTQELTAPSSGFGVVDRAGDQQAQQPRTLISDFEVVERRNTTPHIEAPIPRPSNFNAGHMEPTVPRSSSSNVAVVERTASRQGPASSPLAINTIPPSLVERLLGSLGSIIAELERDDDGNGGPLSRQGSSSAQIEVPAGLVLTAENAVDVE
ncbi:MAG: hypothetical protein Q9208_004161 [Pyrenodesmia sp. 3 TL-2023]